MAQSAQPAQWHTRLTPPSNTQRAKLIACAACIISSVSGASEPANESSASTSEAFAVAELASPVQESGLSINKAIELATRHDPQWSAITQRIEADKQNANIGRAGLLPSIIASGNKLKNERQIDSNPETKYDSDSLSLNATQPIFRADAWFSYQSAKANDAIADEQFEAAYQQFQIRITEQFLNVLRANEQLKSASAEKEAIKRQLDQAKQRLEVGLGTRTEVYEAQAAYDATLVTLINANNAVEVTREQLSTSIGENLTSNNTLLAGISDNIEPKLPAPASALEWVEIALSNSHELAIQKLNWQAAKSSHKAAAGKHLPNVDLVARYNKSHAPDFSNPSLEQKTETTSTGVEFNWAILSGGAINAGRKQAKLRELAARDDYQYSKLSTAQQTRNLFRTVEANILKVNAQQRSLKSSESALEAVQAGYEVGSRNIVDLLDAQRRLFSAKEALANARFDYVLSFLKLKQSAGTLSADDFALISQWQQASAQ